MSLEATHFRFSLAIKDDLQVLDLEKYISGTIYPDTRYLTGIHRSYTHSLDYFEGRKNLSDFEKGWLAHILGDEVCYELLEDKFGELILFEDYGNRWSVLSAIKIIQDIEDFAACDIQTVLDHLDYYELHFHEDERKVIEYNRIIKQMYAGKKKITVEDCFWMRGKLGLSKEKNAHLRKKIIELYEDEKMIKSINENFADGMDLYRSKYRKLVVAEGWDKKYDRFA